MSVEETVTIEDMTRLYYEVQAQEYFDATYNICLKKQWQALSQRLAPGATILDVGCGSGRDLKYFAAKGFCVIGLDYSENLLNLAIEHSGQPVVESNFYALPFLNNSFDAAWAVGSLLHVAPHQIVDVLCDVRRLLKTGGLLFSSIKEGQGEGVEKNGRHFYLYEASDWKKLVEKSGFRLIDQQFTTETRKDSFGAVQEIKWIETLAQVIFN